MFILLDMCDAHNRLRGLLDADMDLVTCLPRGHSILELVNGV